MILDHLTHHAVYEARNPHLSQAFGWLRDFNPELPDGRYEIAGQDLFALVQSYSTAAAGEKSYEAHRDYLDIQYLVAGCETIYHAPAEDLHGLTDYDPAKDCRLYADPAQATALQLTSGHFALFHPWDAHKPGCQAGPVSRVRKVVLKLRV